MAEANSRKAKEEKVALHSLQQAQQCLYHHNYGRAFAHYLIVLKLMPSRKEAIKQDFSLAQQEWAHQLEESGRLTDLFSCFKQACDLFPECETMYNNMGAQLFRLGYVDEAASCFRRALLIDPDYHGAQMNLDNICGHLVERWHFQMLNDIKRNTLYQDAICRAVQAGHRTVLDIGTGTGLLSLFAAEAGAGEVYGCEMSKTMYELSCDVVSANHMEDKIYIIQKSSMDLNIPQDLPQRVSLVITETFDAGLLGEHILETLHHAWTELIDQGADNTIQAQVIPCGATVYACGIESEDIRKQNRLLYPGFQYLDVSSSEIVCTTSQAKRSPTKGKTNSTPGGTTDDHTPGGTGIEGDDDSVGEPYTTERLAQLRGYKVLTDIVEAFQFNFNDPKLVSQYQQGCECNLTLPVKQQGRVDALAMWFDLHLDSETSLSSAPEANSCWEQAIFPVFPSQPRTEVFNQVIIVHPGDTVKVSSGYHGNTFHFDCLGIRRASSTGKTPSSEVTGTTEEPDSNINSALDSCELPYCDKKEHHLGACSGTEAMHTDETHNDDMESLQEETKCETPDSKKVAILTQKQPTLELGKPTYALSREDIGFLNDIDFNSAFCNALLKVKQHYFSDSGFGLIDMSHGMSLLGLQAVKMGAQEVCVMQTGTEKRDLLHSLAVANGIDQGKICFSGRDFQDVEEEWDIVVTDLVESSGCLHQHILEDIALAKVTCLKTQGIVMPCSATVYGMVIESDSLMNDSCVTSNERTMGFHVAEYMNIFQMSTHMNIELSTLQYTALTEPFQLFTFSFSESSEDNVPSYLDQTCSFQLTAIEAGKVTAVVYWFELWLTSDSKVCTLDHNMHWKQAAVMQKDSVLVSCGSLLAIKAACKASCIDISVNVAT